MKPKSPVSSQWKFAFSLQPLKFLSLAPNRFMLSTRRLAVQTAKLSRTMSSTRSTQSSEVGPMRESSCLLLGLFSH